MFSDKQFELITSSNPSTCITSGTAVFGGDSIPILEYSRHSWTPMTIAFLCKETGRTIYRTVELPSEELDVEDEADLEEQA